MHIRAVLGILGALLIISSATFLCGMVTALIFQEATFVPFLGCFLGAVAIGLVFWMLRDSSQELRSRDAFMVVGMCYVTVILVGSVPLNIIPDVAPSFSDAVFESASGITTTGATIISGLDELPKSVLLYRQSLQWVGGMGIIVLAVAILPLLGVGGVQLYKAEAPGSEREHSLPLRVKETAKTLWMIYVGLTVACAIAYFLSGMSVFDAISHSLTTVSIGGFSTHDQSIGFFNSAAIECVAIAFMLISGMNFLVHYVAFHGRKDGHWILHASRSYARDSEVRLYFGVVLLVTVLVTMILAVTEGGVSSPLRDGVFQAVSFATTTGYTTANYEAWPLVCPVLMVFASFVGGCTGSTAGGIKVYRVLLLARQGIREIRRLIQPGAIFNVVVDGRQIPDRVLETAWGFLALYAASFVFLVSAMLIVGDLDFRSAFSAVAACLNNLGPGLGEVSSGYQSLSIAEKWILSFAMILGRLEIFTVLVLFAPRYWRR